MRKRNFFYYYQYLFYKYYSWNIFTNDRTRYEFGWALLSIAEYFNFLTLLLIMQLFTGYGFEQFSNLSKVQITLVWIIFLGFNYIILISNKKYLTIIERFKNENSRSKMIGNLIAFLYFFGSLVIYILIAYFVGVFQRAHV